MPTVSNPPNPVRDVVIVGGGGGSVTPASAIPVVNASVGTGTDRSAATSTSSSTLMAANTSRVGYFIKNDSAIDVWINIGATAVASAGSGNYKIAANGGYLESPAWGCSTAAINIIAASGTPAISAREF